MINPVEPCLDGRLDQQRIQYMYDVINSIRSMVNGSLLCCCCGNGQDVKGKALQGSARPRKGKTDRTASH